MPDGTVLDTTRVTGLLTFTKDHRNFNIMWKDEEGRVLSISYIARYEISHDQYSETSLYYMINDEISGAGVRYDFTRHTGSSPIEWDEGNVKFKMPLFDEPTLVFADDTFTAHGPGFVDYWERVE
jgi:hypothetical protein